MKKKKQPIRLLEFSIPSVIWCSLNAVWNASVWHQIEISFWRKGNQTKMARIGTEEKNEWNTPSDDFIILFMTFFVLQFILFVCFLHLIYFLPFRLCAFVYYAFYILCCLLTFSIWIAYNENSELKAIWYRRQLCRFHITEATFKQNKWI